MAARAWAHVGRRGSSYQPARRYLGIRLVWPIEDVAFRGAELGRCEQVFPDRRTVMPDGAGHYIQEDAPDEIVAPIRDWAGAPGPG